MPIPKPKKGESRDKFISRCHSAIAGEYKDTDQRHAICSQTWRDRNKKANAMLINVKAQPGLIRNEMFQNTDHLVVPMVGLVEGVMLSANATEPALALAEEFGKHVAGWNGRPVVVNHPKGPTGEPVSANSPEVLEGEMIGALFNSELDDKKLKFEAWINISDMKEKHEDGEELIAQLQSGEMMEISTGLFAEEEKVSGKHLGVEFNSIWRNIVPDHLALLPNGIGACSIADGCGAPRANEGEEFCCEPCSRGEPCVNEQGLWVKFLEKLGLKSNRTDADVRMALQAALSETSDSFAFVHAVMGDNTFVFETFDGFFQQSFKIKDDGTIVLRDEPVKVRPETNFVPVNVKAAKKENAVDKTEKVNALISSDKVPFDEDDRDLLMNMDDRKIDEFMQSTEPVADPPLNPPPVEEPPQDPPAANEEPVTAEAFISSAPAEVAEVLRDGMALRTQKREHLIKGILANGKNAFTEDELKAMGMEALEKMASLAQVDDFTARGGPRALPTQAEDEFQAPEPPKVFEVGKKTIGKNAA